MPVYILDHPANCSGRFLHTFLSLSAVLSAETFSQPCWHIFNLGAAEFGQRAVGGAGVPSDHLPTTTMKMVARTRFDPMSPLPPMTMIFIIFFSFLPRRIWNFPRSLVWHQDRSALVLNRNTRNFRLGTACVPPTT